MKQTSGNSQNPSVRVKAIGIGLGMVFIAWGTPLSANTGPVEPGDWFSSRTEPTHQISGSLQNEGTNILLARGGRGGGRGGGSGGGSGQRDGSGSGQGKGKGAGYGAKDGTDTPERPKDGSGYGAGSGSGSGKRDGSGGKGNRGGKGER